MKISLVESEKLIKVIRWKACKGRLIQKKKNIMKRIFQIKKNVEIIFLWKIYFFHSFWVFLD